MASCNGQPVAKISDSLDKTMCRDDAFIAYLKHVLPGRSINRSRSLATGRTVTT